MKKNHHYFPGVLLLVFLILFSFLYLAPVQADQSVAKSSSQKKIQAIDKEFDCIREHRNTKNELEWADVCRTSSGNSSHGIVSRDELVAYALDEYSGEMKTQVVPSKKGKMAQATEEQREDVQNTSTGMTKSYVNDAATPYNYSPLQQPPVPNIETKFNINGGYRTDKLVFNIAGTSSGCCPNILSELTWKDLHSYVVKGSANVTLFDKFVLDGSMDYGDIFGGENQDSDYDGNDRTLEFSRSNNNAAGGNVMDWTGGIGYRFHISGEKARSNFLVDEIWVTPLMGYSRHEQNLRITDGFQTIPHTGSFDHLSSSYETNWKGPWVGFETAGELKKFTAGFRYEYHWADYDARANWNLRNDFAHPKSFEHSARGKGLVLNFTGGYKLTDNWKLDLEFDLQNWKTDPGTDRTFFADGTTADTRLNEVTWESYTVMGGFTYRFGL